MFMLGNNKQKHNQDKQSRQMPSLFFNDYYGYDYFISFGQE